MAGLHVSGQDIMDMGAGGLLKEIPSRPTPREGREAKPQTAPKIAGIILAAGQSTRMGANKLLATIEDLMGVGRLGGAAQATPMTDLIN